MSDNFLSGASGQVWGVRRKTFAVLADGLADVLVLARGQPGRLRAAAREWPRRRVLALSIERGGSANLLGETQRELARSRHELVFASADAGERGKFENLNRLLERHPADGFDWLLVVDDDVALPRGFLDAFIFLLEHFRLQLAQPAHLRDSHAAWEVTRRHPLSVVRETAFVEIGPVVAFHSAIFETLLPFPPLRSGWGLDLHWAALARERGWRMGIVDATPIRHGLRRTASAYDREAAIEEARTFLADRPYLNAIDAARTLATHRSWS